MAEKDNFELILDQMHAPEMDNHEPASEKGIVNNLSNLAFQTAERMLYEVGPCGWRKLKAAGPIESGFRDDTFVFMDRVVKDKDILDVVKMTKDPKTGTIGYEPQIHLAADSPQNCPN